MFRACMRTHYRTFLFFFERRWYHPLQSLVGGGLCIALMWAISWLYAVIASCVWLAVFLSARYGAGTKANFGDSLKTFSIYGAIRSVVSVGLAEPAHPKNFVPQLLVIATPPQWRGRHAGSPPESTGASHAAPRVPGAGLPSTLSTEPLVSTVSTTVHPTAFVGPIAAEATAAETRQLEEEFAVDAPLLRLAASLTASRYLPGGLGYAVVAAVAVGRRHAPVAERAKRLAAAEAVIERRIRDVTGAASDRMFAEVRGRGHAALPR